jgi:hypothetical protein
MLYLILVDHWVHLLVNLFIYIIHLLNCFKLNLFLIIIFGLLLNLFNSNHIDYNVTKVMYSCFIRILINSLGIVVILSLYLKQSYLLISILIGYLQNSDSSLNYLVIKFIVSGDCCNNYVVRYLNELVVE